MTSTVTRLRPRGCSDPTVALRSSSLVVIRLMRRFDDVPSSWVHFTLPTGHGAARVRATYRTLRNIGVSRTEARYAVVQLLLAAAPTMTGGRP
jgi:hypothetical protein